MSITKRLNLISNESYLLYIWLNQILIIKIIKTKLVEALGAHSEAEMKERKMDMKMLRAKFLRDVVLPCNWDVLITTYEIVNIEKSYLKRINWRYIVSGSKSSK